MKIATIDLIDLATVNLGIEDLWIGQSYPNRSHLRSIAIDPAHIDLAAVCVTAVGLVTLFPIYMDQNMVSIVLDERL